MKKLLLVGDFACHTGFAQVNEALASHLCETWEIHVLALNYKGDPHPLQQQFALYPAWLGGDAVGVGRLALLANHIKPDAILAVNDPWIVKLYLEVVADLPDAPPVAAYMPVDGTNLRPEDIEPLNALAHAIAYTRFGRQELRKAGYAGELSVIPHGVDLTRFGPRDRDAVRQRLGLPTSMFAVLLLDQNQARKRLDIAFDAFAQFAKHAPDARLIYHGPLLAEKGWDILAMAEDLGIYDRLITTDRVDRRFRITQTNGIRPEDMPDVYALADVKLTTTSGEGWGLTTMEAMACGVPNLIPAFGALFEWAGEAAWTMPAEIPVRHAGGINTVGMVPRAETVAEALRQMARQGEHDYYRRHGLDLVSQDCYRWDTIARQFDAVLKGVAG